MNIENTSGYITSRSTAAQSHVTPSEALKATLISSVYLLQRVALFIVVLLFATSVWAVDTDGDGVDDSMDSAPLDQFTCQDSDGDSCDDCALGYFDPADDGLDTDGDGICDVGDVDDDNDGVLDNTDSNPQDPNSCGDVDADTCDDCAGGYFDPAGDGPDTDGDGICDAGDSCADLDGDAVCDVRIPVNVNSYSGRT